MKKVLFCSLLFCVSNISSAQRVNGKILLNQHSQNSIELKSNEAVSLYAQLRENEMPIHFIFEGSDLPKTASGNGVAQFAFRTTLKFDGKEVASVRRNPMPFFPGDMFMPIETFDLVPILASEGRHSQSGNLKPGKYEVIFEASPLDAKGAIRSASLLFEVR